MARDYYHVIAIRPGDRRKSITNKSEDEVLTQAVIPFVSSGTIKARWGSRTTSHQVLELRVYKTRAPFDRKAGGSLDEFVAGKRNHYSAFEKRAKKALGVTGHRVFVVMPIQGEKSARRTSSGSTRSSTNGSR